MHIVLFHLASIIFLLYNNANVERVNALNLGSSTKSTRREAILKTVGLVTGAGSSGAYPSLAYDLNENENIINAKRKYIQRFPTLFAPLYGEANEKETTTPQKIGENIWSIEQNLELGPLQVPIRCVVIRLSDGSLWVHNPLAPTEEFFEAVESLLEVHDGEDQNSGNVGKSNNKIAYVVVPTYALEHKVFAKDALERWPDAQLWTAPGQFSFPIRNVSTQYIWGRDSDKIGTLSLSSLSKEEAQPKWIDEIEYETLKAGTFTIGSSLTSFYETAFFHKKSKSLVVTDALIRIPPNPPESNLNDPEKLLLISKKSTSDPQPPNTFENRKIGWEKTCLLVSYFFPEHEEPDPEKSLGVVTWTDGWHDNFLALSDRLLVPPVVRTLIYAQDSKPIEDWVDRILQREQNNKWDFTQIVPAHFDGNIKGGPQEFKRAFEFLEDESIDAFPENDLKRGLKPIADLALGKKDKGI